MKTVKVHMMGINGSGISGVASLASKMGYEVTGCDLQTGEHSKDHLKKINLLVVTPAVFYQSSKNPELVEGKRRGIVLTWQEFLGKYLMKDKFVIAVAGTHGKSTTTAMVGKLLEDNGFDPTVLVGARVPEWNGNSRYGKSKYFVIEADEFNDNFLNYHPEIAIINNIEFDHPDYFKDEKQLETSFNKFIKRLVGKKILIIPAGFNPAVFRGCMYEVRRVQPLQKKFKLKILGDHNQKNANMAYALGKYLKIPEKNIIKSIENFQGIGRRMEMISKNIFDDYAHHPTAIKTTLAGLRNNYPDKKIWAIIEPHGYSRTKALLDLYGGVFASADKVIIGPIFKARDNKTFGMTPEKIAAISGHSDIKTGKNLEEIEEKIKKDYKKGDILIVMGAGESSLWAKHILKTLQH